MKHIKSCPEELNKELLGPSLPLLDNVRNYNVGTSDYCKHKIQPWDIWQEYHLNPWDADIVKRVLRTKEVVGMSAKNARILDYQKIIHICQERIRQLENNYEF